MQIDKDGILKVKWEKLEETKLMNAPNILAICEYGAYRLGRLVNGEFYEMDYTHISRHRKVEIDKYAELPEIED